MTADTPSMHGTVAEAGDFRIESSSAPETMGGEAPLATLERVLLEERARAGEPVIAAPESTDDGETPAPKAETKTAPLETTPDETAPKKPGKMQVRHDELQARVHALTRDRLALSGQIEAEQRRLDELKAQADALAAGKAPAPADGVKAPASAVPADDQKPTWRAFEDAGKTFDEYEEARDAWQQRQHQRDIEAAIAKTQAKLDADRKAQADAAAQTDAHARSVATVQSHVQALSAEDPDIAAALQTDDFLDMPRTPFLSALLTLHPAGKDVMRHLALNPADGYAFADLGPLSAPMMEAFKATQDPVKLLAALANNPSKAQQIRQMGDYAAMRALIALETSAPDAKTGSSGAAPRQPSATPLPAKVGGSRTVATQRPLHELTTDDIDEFARRVNAGEDV